MKRPLIRLCTALALLAGAAPAVHATPISYNGYTVLNNQNVTLNDPSLNINNEQGGSGQVTLMNLSTGGSMMTWCVDISDELLTSGTFSGVVVMTGAAWNGINALITNGTALLGSDVNASAALQVAIWEEKYGSNLSVSAASAVTSEAQTFLTNVSNGTWRADTTKAVAVLQGNNANQDQAYLIKVPEPASLALLGAGLLAAVALRRSTTRQPKLGRLA